MWNANNDVFDRPRSSAGNKHPRSQSNSFSRSSNARKGQQPIDMPPHTTKQTSSTLVAWRQTRCMPPISRSSRRLVENSIPHRYHTEPTGLKPRCTCIVYILNKYYLDCRNCLRLGHHSASYQLPAHCLLNINYSHRAPFHDLPVRLLHPY